MKNKKKVTIILITVLLLILLFPIKLRIKDGGSVEYRAILYKVTKVHSLSLESSNGYETGWRISILGFNIYSNVFSNKDKLDDINNRIIQYFQTNGVNNYDNYSYNYVDEKNNVVVVGLIDNSKKQQDWFKKNVVDSKYIKFEQGEHVKVSRNISVVTQETCDSTFEEYYKGYNRTVYFNCIDEFYFYNDNKETLKDYLSVYLQSFEDGIKQITNQLEVVDVVYDGGTKIYQSKAENVTMVVCNTLAGDKDVYIGNYSVDYGKFYRCKN